MAMLEIVRETIPEAVDALAADGDGAAMRYEGSSFTAADLAETSRQFAGGVAALGHEKGEPAALWLPNRPEWFEAYTGFGRVGAPVVAVNTRYRTHELEYMLEDSGTTTLVMQGSFLTRDFVSMLRDICPAVDKVEPSELGAATDLALEHVVVLDPDGDAEVPRAARTYDEILAAGRDADTPLADVSVDPSDPATVFYTSGTTGDPKGVVHDHVSTVNHPRFKAEQLGATADDTALAIIPVVGVAGFDFAWSALLIGATLVLQSSFDGEAAAAAIESKKVTYIAAVGEMFEAMLGTDHDLTSLERGSVYLTDADQLATIEEVCEFPVCQPYGLSEGHSHMCISQPEAPREQRYAPGGPPIHEDIDIQIRDTETGAVRDPGEAGELYLRGYCRMVEYLNKPEKTAEDIDADGWLATGDAGEIDEQGHLLYHSRIDDMLRLRGFRVTPQEIGGAIQDHEAVDLAQVVGVPQDDSNEIAVAFVKLADGAGVDADELAAFMNDHVADYKVPSRFEFVDEFPTTESPNGVKIQRSKLADRADSMVNDAGSGA